MGDPALSLREIKREGTSKVQLTWSDGSVNNITSEILRRNCPCAFCRAKRGDESHDTPIIKNRSKRSLAIVQSSSTEEFTIVNIWPVGNYALGIEWADGHRDGIYTFGFLLELSVG